MVRLHCLADLLYKQAAFPISAKKCEIFSGIFALNFCEVRRFYLPSKNRRFYFTPKTVDCCGFRRHAHVCCTKPVENLRISDRWPFFFFSFWERHKIRQKDASVSAMTFSGESQNSGRKFFHHCSTAPQELRHFCIEFRTFALFLAFTQEVKSLRGHCKQVLWPKLTLFWLNFVLIFAFIAYWYSLDWPSFLSLRFSANFFLNLSIFLSCFRSMQNVDVCYIPDDLESDSFNTKSQDSSLLKNPASGKAVKVW